MSGFRGPKRRSCASADCGLMRIAVCTGLSRIMYCTLDPLQLTNPRMCKPLASRNPARRFPPRWAMPIRNDFEASNGAMWANLGPGSRAPPRLLWREFREAHQRRIAHGRGGQTYPLRTHPGPRQQAGKAGLGSPSEVLASYAGCCTGKATRISRS